MKKIGLILAFIIFGVGLVASYFYLTPEYRLIWTQKDPLILLRVDPLNDFAQASIYRPVRLPDDFAWHPEFRHENWQFFANLWDSDGKPYTVQWSYRRFAQQAEQGLQGWADPQLYVMQVAVTNKEKQLLSHSLARGGIGQAGMSSQPFRLWLDNHFWRSLGNTPFPGQLNVHNEQFSFSLYTNIVGPYVLPGVRGYQRQHSTLPIASHQWQAPFIQVRGQLMLDSDQLVEVQGKAWLSKEWTSIGLGDQQQGWDWLVLHLNDQSTVSITHYLATDDAQNLSGVFASTDGKVSTLLAEDIQFHLISTANSTQNPSTQWQLIVKRLGIDVIISSNELHRVKFDALFPYEQSSVTTTGSHQAVGFIQRVGNQ